MGMRWVMAGNVKNELWAWAGICKKKKHLFFISLTIFWDVWKERNVRVFEEIETDFVNIKNRWFHTFGSTLLDHDILDWDDLGCVIDHLIDM